MMAETQWVNNLRALVLSGSTLTLSWSLDGSWEDLEQRVWCRNSGSTSGEWSYVYDVHEDARSFTWYDCNPGQSYDFCVGARNKGGQWYYGYLYGVRMDAMFGASAGSESVPSGSIKVEVEQNPDAELGGFDVWWRDDSESLNGEIRPYGPNEDAYRPDGSSKATWHQMLGCSGSSVTVEDLRGGRWYTFWVRQHYAAGGYTEATSVRAFLGSVTALKYEVESAESVKLSWTPNGPLSRIDWTSGGSGEAPTEGAEAQVWRQALVGNREWVLAARLEPSATGYIDSSFGYGGEYRWCVLIRDWTDSAFQWGNWDGDTYTPYVTVPRMSAPKTPTYLKAEFANGTMQAVLNWRNNPVAITQPYERVYVRMREYGGDWEVADVLSGTAESCEVPVVGGRMYEFVVQAWNREGFSKYSSIEGFYASPQRPEAPTDPEASLDGDAVAVTWKSAEEDGKPYQSVQVEVSVNDGAWRQAASVAGSAERYSMAADGDCCYRFRLRAVNQGGMSAYSAESNRVYTKPAAPSAARVARTADGGCSATWGLRARYATLTQVAPMWRDGGEWEEMPYADLLPTAERMDDPPVPEGTAQTSATMAYLVRSVIEQGDSEEDWLYSDWSPMSNACEPCAAPAAPDIVHPSPGCVVASPNSDRPTAAAGAPGARLSSGIALGTPLDASGSVTVEGASEDRPSVTWRHNAVDGSMQTRAQVELSWGAVSGTAEVEGDAMTLADALPACGISVDSLQASYGNRIYTEPWTCRVRTMGAKAGSAGWSPWSSASFSLRRRPRVSVARPGAGDFDGDVAVLSEYPVTVALDYADYGFRLMDATLTVSAPDGSGGFSRSFGAATEMEVPTDVWAPLNGAEYAMTVTVRSTSGLSNSVGLKVRTAFPRPKVSSLRIECDDERGWATLTPHVDMSDEAGRAVESLSVWRCAGGQTVLVAEGLADGEEVVDRFAPLNTEVTYLLGAYSDQGVYEVTEHVGSVRSQYCFLYHGQGFAGIARGLWNHTQSVSLSRSRQVKQMYAGRKYPVLHDGGGVEEARTVEFVVEGEEEWREFSRAADYGECFFKSLDGEAFRCSASIGLSTPSDLPHGWRTVTLDLERVDGRAL